MRIKYADQGDFDILRKHDKHIHAEELERSIAAKRVLAAFHEGAFTGWLRFNLFWDSLPFVNMLYLLEEYRGKGYGGGLLRCWEREMADAGCRQVLASTLSNERAQFFFRKNGYVDCGALLLPGEPLEIILRKDLA